MYRHAIKSLHEYPADDGVIPAAEFEQYEPEYENAQEEVASTQNNLALIREGQTRESGKTTNTFIRSTIDGMVLDVPVKQGNPVIESNTFNILSGISEDEKIKIPTI